MVVLNHKGNCNTIVTHKKFSSLSCENYAYSASTTLLSSLSFSSFSASRRSSISIDCFSASYIQTIQYNRSLISSFVLMHAKIISALSRLDGADAMVLQSIVSEELAQGTCVAASTGFEPATLRAQGTKP